jgi:aspartate racemase
VTKHIGIAAVSGPGAALCHETICAEAPARLGPYAHPEITLHAFSFAEHMRLLERGDWPGVAELLLASARKLAATGADFAICPDNTAHAAFPLLAGRSPIPWLHIAEAVAAEARERGLARLGVLGTRWLVESEVYPEKLAAAGLEWRLPAPAERQAVDRIIFDDLVYARFPEAARDAVVRVIERLRDEEGCDAVVLGCTELPLLVPPDASPLPVLDSTRLLARAAIARAVG